MLVEYIVRGNEIVFTASFEDADGDPVDPVSVSLDLSFMGDDGRTSDTIAMTDDTDGVWSASWDSSVAAQGRVYWAVRASDPPGADEGFFDLTANLANLGPDTA